MCKIEFDSMLRRGFIYICDAEYYVYVITKRLYSIYIFTAFYSSALWD